MVDRFGGQTPGRRQRGTILRDFAIPEAPGDVLKAFSFLQRLFAFREDFSSKSNEFHMERKTKKGKKNSLCQSPESASPPSRSFTTSAATESTGEGNDTSIEPDTKF